MKNKLIYLASPYSKYPKGKEQAFRETCIKAAQLMERGYYIFAPISHSHPIEDIGMPFHKDGEFWLNQDFEVLKRCDELWVYKMPGWDYSYGVEKEIKFAQQHNIPIHYIEYEKEQQYAFNF